MHPQRAALCFFLSPISGAFTKYKLNPLQTDTLNNSCLRNNLGFPEKSRIYFIFAPRCSALFKIILDKM